MRDDVKAVLRTQYEKTLRWQALHGMTVAMTFEEFTSLWSAYRLRTLSTKIDKGDHALERYLRNPVLKPVCSWVSKDARASGVMTKDNARIFKAEEARRVFQFDKGDRHSPESIQKMRKPKTAKHKANMSQAAKARWAKWREERASGRPT